MIAYILLCGYPPFYGKTDKEIFASVRRGEYDFPGPEWDTVSDAAKEFVEELLMLDPGERPTASEALKLPWLHALDDEEEKAEGKAEDAGTAAARMNQPLHLSSKLRTFTGMSNLKRTALNVIANQLTEADIGKLPLLSCLLAIECFVSDMARDRAWFGWPVGSGAIPLFVDH